MDSKPKSRGPSREGKNQEKEKSQVEPFIETARQIAAAESDEEFEKAIKQVHGRKRPPS